MASLDLRIRGNSLCTFVNRGNTNGAAALGTVTNVRAFRGKRVCISNVDLHRGPVTYGRELTCVPSGPSLCRCLANVRCLGFVTSMCGVPSGRHRSLVTSCTSHLRVASTLNSLVSNCSRNVGRGLTVLSTLVRGPHLVVLSRPFMKLSPGTTTMIGSLVRRLYRSNKTIFFSARILRMTRGLYGGITVVGSNGLIGSNEVRSVINSSSLRRVFLSVTSSKNDE